MTLLIILNASQEDEVRGATIPGHALEPIALANGTEWILPPRVLQDPAHVEWHDYLAALPQRNVDPSEFPQDTN